MREQSPVMVVRDQDEMRDRRTHQPKYGPHGLTGAIKAHNVPAVQAKTLPIDVMWTSDGHAIAGDIKTAQDFIASYTDGRLHDQITSMQKMNCRFYFIFLEGPLSFDGGNTVGDGLHGWTWNQFDNALLDVQVMGGVKVISSWQKTQTPGRIASVWNWTAKEDVASWQHPVPIVRRPRVEGRYGTYGRCDRLAPRLNRSWPRLLAALLVDFRTLPLDPDHPTVFSASSFFSPQER